MIILKIILCMLAIATTNTIFVDGIIRKQDLPASEYVIQAAAIAGLMVCYGIL